MTRLIRCLTLAFGFSTAQVFSSVTTNEILTRLQNCIEEERPTTELEETLADLSNKELSLLISLRKLGFTKKNVYDLHDAFVA